MPVHAPPVPSARDGSRVGWEAARPRRESQLGLRASGDRIDGVPRRADRALLALTNEVEDLVHEGVIVELAGHVLDPLGQGAFIREQQAIGAADFVNLVAGKATAA